jgi:murein L,D-transpeptidase YcbB/YkuD
VALSWQLVSAGATGEDVRSIQYFLNASGNNLAIDGDFGPLTKSAVQAFQGSHGLAADGIVGDQTWPALIVQVANGSQGDAVKALQSQISSRGADPLAIDGIFGPDTQAAVQQFQTWVGLTVDGIVGPITWNAYVDGYLPGPTPDQVAQVVFRAWSQNDQLTVKKNASVPSNALAELFAQAWSASQNWAFVGPNGAAGTVYYQWKDSSGQQLALGVSDGPGGYFYLAAVNRQ